MVSSTITVSLRLELLRGGGGVGVRPRRTSSMTTSLCETLDAVLRREDRRAEGALRGGDRERRRITSSSMIDERP